MEVRYESTVYYIFLKLKPQQLPKEMGLCGVSNSLSLWLSASFFSSLERYENIS